MSRHENTWFFACLLLFVCFVAAPSNAPADEPFLQADVYDALYSAHVQCDDDLDLSRSEFITNEIERNGSNRLSKEMLAKLLAHNVETARKTIAEKTQERKLIVSEMLRAPTVSSEESIETRQASRERHERLRQIDELLKRHRRYVEVYDCVIGELQRNQFGPGPTSGTIGSEP